jgi:inner membrane protein
MGVRYADRWGHRGATHSVIFALALATVIALLAPRFVRPRLRMTRAKSSSLTLWGLASAVLVSHGLLDTLTDGGLGCALLWPFDLTRYFAPWRPIPVAPIGLAFFSSYGLFVSSIELVLFAPFVVYGLRPKRVPWPLIPVWCLLVWLMVSTDPIRERVLSVILREHTEYAPDFSERSFQTIALGQAEGDVRGLLGAPLGEWWDYRPPRLQKCPFVYVESDVVTVEVDAGPAAALCAQRGIHPGMSAAEARRVLGPPDSICGRYSRNPGRGYFRARVVCFADDKVEFILQSWVRR